MNTAPTFIVGDGTITTAIGTGQDDARSHVVQPDGKIILAGFAYMGTFDFALVRYNADGTLDTTFGGGTGKVTTPIGSGNDLGFSVALQSNGRIVVGGYAYNGSNDDFALVRYNADGSLDTSFGTGGKVTTPIGTWDQANNIVVQSDGKIVAVGYAQSATTGVTQMTAVRYNSNGTLDTTFGTAGNVVVQVGASYSYGQDVVIQPDGKLVIGGYGYSTAGFSAAPDFAVLRLNANGSVDTGFGSSGRVLTDFAASGDEGRSVVLQSDGKIIVVGSAIETGNQIGIARYNSNGSLDTSFGGGDGKVILGSGVIGTSVTIQSDGKIIVVGRDLSNTSQYYVSRLNSDGSTDSTFGTAGIAQISMGFGESIANSVSVLADGRIVVAGSANGDFGFVRLMPNGTPDPTIDTVQTLNGGTTFREDAAPVVMDGSIKVYDAELFAAGNYAGLSLTIARQGGANAEDLFGFGGNINALPTNGAIVHSGVTIGTVVQNSGGQLSLIFNTNATQTLINSFLSGLSYSNSSNTPPSSVSLTWTMSDGNTGAQGAGGALSTSNDVTIFIQSTNDVPVFTLPGIDTFYAPDSNEFRVDTAVPGTRTWEADQDQGGWQIDQDESIEPVIATLSNGNYVVVYGRLYSGGPYGIEWDLFAQVIAPDGTKVGTEIAINTDNHFVTGFVQVDPVVTALADGKFAVAWASWQVSGNQNATAIFTRTFDGTTQLPISSEVRADSIIANSFTWSGDGDALGWQPLDDDSIEPQIVTLDNGNYLVVYGRYTSGGTVSGANWDILGQIFSPTGAKVGGEIAINTAAPYVPHVTGDVQTAPVVTALDGGGFAVAWQANFVSGNSNSTAIFTRTFNSSGTATSTDTRVDVPVHSTKIWEADFDQQGLQVDQDYSIKPQIVALENGGYVVVFGRYFAFTNSWDTRAQVFSSSGVKVGSEFIVHSTDAGNQIAPAVAALTGGGFAISWQADQVSGNAYNSAFYTRTFAANGQATSSDVRLDLATGSVTSWAADYDQDGFQIDQDYSFSPRITALDNGNYVVVYGRFNIPSQQWDIKAQVLGSTGYKIGGEISINTDGQFGSSQINPVVTALQGGGFAVAWQANNVGGNSNSTAIISRTYEAATTTLAEPSITTDEDTPTGPLIIATDADGHTLTYTLVTGQEPTKGAVSFAPNGAMTYTPNANVSGNDQFMLVVSDGNGGTIVRTFTVSINAVNDTPTLSAPIADATAYEDEAFTLALPAGLFTDIEDANLTYSATLTGGGALPSWLTFNSATGTFSGTPLNGDVGTISVTVTATDSGSLSVSDTFDLTVEDTTGVTITGTSFADTVNATASVAGQPLPTNKNDIISTGNGNDVIAALGGRDTIAAGRGFDIIDAGAGNDTILYVTGDASDTIDGGADFDTLVITGVAGTDNYKITYDGSAITVLNGGAISNVESVTLDLLGGTNTILYTAPANAAITVNLAAGTASGFTSIANVTNVTGGSGRDTLIGTSGANTLNGGAGNDILIGGAGVDLLIGGSGSDTIVYADETDDLIINLAANTVDRITGGFLVREDNLSTVENAVGGAGNDYFYGNNSANRFEGGDGIDVFEGGYGADILLGGAGNDVFYFWIDDGADTIDGGDGVDSLFITGSEDAGIEANDRLDVVFDGVQITSFESATVTGVEAIFAGLGGGIDRLHYGATSVGITVNLAAETASGFVSIGGIENVTGGQGNDTIIGNNLDNSLHGGAGNDILTGLGGSDTFVFTPGLGHDTILDFDGEGGPGAQDFISLVGFGITNAALLFANVSFAEAGSDVVLTVGGGTGTITITIANATLAGPNAITDADFIFSA